MFDKLGFVELGFVELGFVEVGFGFVELGFVELLGASKAFNLFFASAANFPLGYSCKYALKSSGFVLSLTVCQNASSVRALFVWVPPSRDDLGRLRFVAVAGAGFFDVVVFFVVAVGVGFAMTSPPLPWPADATRLIGSHELNAGNVIIASKEMKLIDLRIGEFFLIKRHVPVLKVTLPR